MSENEIIQDVRERVIKIETILLKNTENNNEKFKNFDRRITEIENNMKWFIYALIGGVVTLIFSLFK